ncbi:hypothetical protein LOTGIDRAFT_175274 [Lottia gigantea]|uniref:Mutator-like transposase domain-containing protein n=1 Tax=Lottia gigantea TaxID=225164 RepID=V4ADJ9_LOTGI|nr:hypothetical protein LOTGIDRAFT_175274 [Lottia gigantea]ESO94922.1 hypothetical protein LOTGIDRAFT_175274 [Lottia gigantea]
MPLGNSMTRLLLADLDIPPPAESGHRKKPGQGASQSIGIACETNTDKKYIISAVLQNKLCWTGAWLRNTGITVNCPGHEGCTANLTRHAPLTEREMGRIIGEDLSIQGMLIMFATTDGDSTSATGIEEAMRTLHPMWKVERLADPAHLSASQFRQCFKANFLDGMFRGKTKVEKTNQKKTLSQDIKSRCSLVIKEMYSTYCGDVDKLKKQLPKILQATVMCYDGDCSKCRSNSVVCSGGHSNNWWNRSMFLASNNLTSLEMNDNDKFLLNELLKIRLSEEAIDKTRYKTESINRSINISLPKSVNYGRNAMGRLSSTILRSNIGIKEATQTKAEFLGAKLSPKCLQALSSIQKKSVFHRDYETRPEVKRRKLLARGRNIHEFAKYKKFNTVGTEKDN